MTNAEVAANYAAAFLARYERGAYQCEDRIILFGNDAYSTDPRSQREVEIIRDVLPLFGIVEYEFGVTSEGTSWAIVVDNRDGEPIDVCELSNELWGCWFGACEEKEKKVE